MYPLLVSRAVRSNGVTGHLQKSLPDPPIRVIGPSHHTTDLLVSVLDCAGFCLLFLGLNTAQLFWAVHAVNEQDAVQVVYLVLEGAGQ